jgi:hypothetical protein
MSDTAELPVNDAPAPDTAPAPALAEQTSPAPKPDEKKPEYGSWQDRLIASQRKQREAAERERDQFRSELERLRAAAPANQPDPNDPAVIRRQAEEAAVIRLREETEARQFNEACAQTADRIRTEFGAGGLQEAAAGWRNVGLDLSQPNHRELLSLLTEVEGGHKLYHDIGKNPDFAAHLLELSPKRAAFEVARYLPAAQAKELRAEAAQASDATPTEAPSQPAAAPATKPLPAISAAPRPPAQPAASRAPAPGARDIFAPNATMEDHARNWAERQKARRK